LVTTDQVNGNFISGITHVSASVLSRNILYKKVAIPVRKLEYTYP